MTSPEGSGWGDEFSPARGHGLPVAKYSDDGKWRLSARCREQDKSVFFVEGGQGNSARTLQDRRELALFVCAECPVRMHCLNYALCNEERHGIWGGIDFSRLSSIERISLLSRIEKVNL